MYPSIDVNVAAPESLPSQSAAEDTKVCAINPIWSPPPISLPIFPANYSGVKDVRIPSNRIWKLDISFSTIGYPVSYTVMPNHMID